MVSFMERLISREYNLCDEIITIENLIKQYINNNCIYDCVNANFSKWKHRNNFVNLKQLYEGMALDAVINIAERDDHISRDVFLYYAEFVYNVLRVAYYFSDYAKTKKKECENVKIIKENIEKILNQLNCELHYDKKNDYYKIILSDFKVELAAEIVQDNYNLGELIYDYKHYKLQGNIDEKSDKLCRLHKYFETIQGKLEKFNFGKLNSDIGFLAQKLNIRHSVNKKEQELLETMTAIEKENWLDITFDLYLEAIILSNCIDQHKKVEELKRRLSEIK